MGPTFGAIENDRLLSNGQRKSCVELCDITLPVFLGPHLHKCGRCEIGWVHSFAHLIGRIRESPFCVGRVLIAQVNLVVA